MLKRILDNFRIHLGRYVVRPEPSFLRFLLVNTHCLGIFQELTGGVGPIDPNNALRQVSI